MNYLGLCRQFLYDSLYRKHIQAVNINSYNSTIDAMQPRLTIFPCRQIGWIPPNLASCCHLCYASSVCPLDLPFGHVIESALYIRLVQFKTGVVMIDFELLVFVNLSSSFVMRDINPKNSTKHGSVLWSPWGWGHCFSSNQVHSSIRTHLQQVP